MKKQSLLMIPGPIAFDRDVLAEMGAPTRSHVAPDFIEEFGQAIERMRKVFKSPDGQPFIVAGSGTLAMDLAGANLVEAGDRVLVVNTGYFGDRFGKLLERYGAVVEHVRADVGSRPSLQAIEEKIIAFKPVLMTVTHVDTSTGVITDAKGIAALARKHDVIMILDGVCSVAGEEIDMAADGIDLVLTASQKAVGVPPGLALLVAGPRAMAKFNNRKSPVPNFYADWANWLPIMQAYENRKGAYFGTPAVNLVSALNVSLKQILEEGLDERMQRHVIISQSCKKALTALGLKQVPVSTEFAAHTMSAPYYPDPARSGELLKIMKEEGVVTAGGLHAQIKDLYFRIGHMGFVDIGDVLKTIAALETALYKTGYNFEPGTGVAAALKEYLMD